ncbi:hypothetical protein PHPALM_30864 [Phytophthora palmivora]|uniref:Uncharacterized protein n=1 Tax=Phytophthora palmivora TaxID=4796 RepID=A0A2P4X421_9STRA|nr:hypothetical protein PHPALM_30864 [Phytophthora palmivora]
MEKYLLAKARIEETHVVQNLMARMYGRQYILPSQVSTTDIMKLWLDSTVITVAKQHINANLDTNKFISESKVKAFLQVELWLSFYSVSPTMFYDPANKKFSHAIDAVRRVCSEFGFVPEVSITSLDDALLTIYLPGKIFALDRGYQSKEVNLQIINSGGSIIGTHKRNSNFPFIYGKSGGLGQNIVYEDGPRFAQWATSN